VIGKAGQRIKQVRLDSGADVELSDSSGGTSDRIITITGTLQQIQAAQYMMQMAYVSHYSSNSSIGSSSNSSSSSSSSCCCWHVSFLVDLYQTVIVSEM